MNDYVGIFYTRKNSWADRDYKPNAISRRQLADRVLNMFWNTDAEHALRIIEELNRPLAAGARNLERDENSPRLLSAWSDSALRPWLSTLPASQLFALYMKFNSDTTLYGEAWAVNRDGRKERINL